VAETDSAANQFGAHVTERKNRRADISVVCGPCLPLAHLSDLWRAIMKTFNTLPGESGTSIISSIINAVCPQCGGRMSAFQCDGRCRRNWLAEWEWANQATRCPKVRTLGRVARQMR